MLSGSVASISSKFAAMYANRLGFMAVSYFMGTIFALGLKARLDTGGGKKNNHEAVVIGVIMGCINFGGFYAFLQALAVGPLSLVISMVGIHFVIAILLSSLIYKERLTHLRLIGIGLAIVSVVLLKM
jgi:drug/metabolite transporter (DMT)-like permease